MPEVVSSTVSVSVSSEADSGAGYCVTAEVVSSRAWISMSTDSDSAAGDFVVVDVLMLVTLSLTLLSFTAEKSTARLTSSSALCVVLTGSEAQDFFGNNIVKWLGSN